MSTSNPGATGAFHLSVPSGTWTWSEALYTLFGFTPGDVVPTLELLLSHQHPDDRTAVAAAFEDAQGTGSTFSVWHRLRDAQGHVRQVLTVGGGERGPSGEVVGISGYVCDVTEFVRRTTSRDVDAAIELIGQSRPAIDQAKGVLMMRFGLDDEAGFELLRRYSQEVNVKLRDVAREVVEGTRFGRLPGGRVGLWDKLADEVRPQPEDSGRPG